MMNKKCIGIADYKSLLAERDQLDKKYKKLGRLRDLKVNFINDKYQCKINDILLKLDYLNGEIDNCQRFIKGNK